MDPRTALDELILQKGTSYASISRLLGRNPAYIHQFIRRGSPRELDERDRVILAQHFEVDESVLGGPTGYSGPPIALIAVPVLAQAGRATDSEAAAAQVGFDNAWLSEVADEPSRLSIMAVRGDSMEPTLCPGDQVLLARPKPNSGISDGIYLLRSNDSLVLRRIALEPRRGFVTVRSDNPAYPMWTGIRIANLDLVGRVVWFGRRLP